jgi:hypothetical protein
MASKRRATFKWRENRKAPRRRPEAEGHDAWTSDLRTAQRKRAFVVFGNVLLFGVLIGLPYARGHYRARDLTVAYGRLSACLYGGHTITAPGLGPLPNEAGLFAAQFLAHGSSLTQRCAAELSAMSPPEDLLVLPGLKGAEADVREGLRVLLQELAALPSELPVGARIPGRPVRAMQQLRRLLEKHSEEAGLFDPPRRAAAAFSAAHALAEPSRVPLYAGSDAVIELWGSDAELEAVGVDRTGLSYVHIEPKTIDKTRQPRPPLLRGFSRNRDRSHLLWSMARDRCDKKLDRCAGKAVGIARARWPITRFPVPRWLAGYPAARLDRSLLRIDRTWTLVATTLGQANEVREFLDPLLGEADPPEDLPVLRPTRTWDFAVEGDALVVQSRGQPRVLVADHVDDGTSLTLLEPERATALAKLAKSTSPITSSPWTVSCTRDDLTGFAFGNSDQLLLGQLEGGQARVWPAVPLRTSNVLHESEPARDRVIRICSSTGPLALVLDAAQRLNLVRCDARDSTCQVDVLAESIRHVAALDLTRVVLVAFAGDADQAQIRVLRLDAQGKPLGTEQIPGGCWAPRGGMCDQPLLARIGNRVVLGAREETDLMALESPDLGVSWQSLAGVVRRDRVR